MKKYDFKVSITKGETGLFVAECLNLPGCVSQGKTKEMALENIKEAISDYIDVLIEDNIPIPFKEIELVDYKIKVTV
ncbi:MAG: type II toxin-antitoxin system HicB family antitoxin [Methanosarcinales archaeon]